MTEQELNEAVERARVELDRQSEEGDIFYRRSDDFIDGRVSLKALVKAIFKVPADV